MAQITVVYKDFDDMLATAQQLVAGLGTTHQNRGVQKQETAPAAQTQQKSESAAQMQQATVPTVPVQQATAPPAQPVPVIPTSTRAYTLEELQQAATPLMDAGKYAELQNLLKSFGASSLIGLPPEQYGNFATALRGLGANI